MNKYYTMQDGRAAKLRNYLADGIAYYDDPGHGWIVISPERLAEMRANAPHLLIPTRFYDPGQRHFEQDVEASRVVLAFPEIFKPEQVKAAERTLQQFHPEIMEQHAALAA